jgi:GTP 3',8-cyclase
MTPALVDSFGRTAADLRISITDKCNLRCTYCMPEEGLEWLPREKLLSVDEISTLAEVFVECGIRSIRLTGGEPLVRHDVVGITKAVSLLGLDDLSMTTNGVRLDRMAGPLKEAGLQRVNVSLDSLDPASFALITRRDDFARVIKGIEAAVEVGLQPMKINCVAVRGVNDHEIVAFARFARDYDIDVRFIEPMPLDGDRAWVRDNVIAGAEIVELINNEFSLEPADNNDARPATPYRFTDGSKGSIGVVASVTDPFCETCDRLRLTADGQLRTCLFSETETDLRTPLRDGASRDELSEIISVAVGNKQAGHQINNVTFRQPNRTMSSIGG